MNHATLKKTHLRNRTRKRKFNRHFTHRLSYIGARRAAKDATSNVNFVVNLSEYTLTKSEKDILTKGLNFVPTPKTLPNYNPSLYRFKRAHRLSCFFSPNLRNIPRPLHPFRSKSNWVPPPASSRVEGYLANISEKFEILTKKNIRFNTSKEEWRAIISLKRNNSIVIKSADKGSSIVVEDIHQYIANGLAHLQDKNIYKQVDRDPTQDLITTINSYVAWMKKMKYIDVHTYRYLTLKSLIRSQRIYFLKKIHKTPHSVRPIVSGCGGPTEKLSAFMDHYLKPRAEETKSYIRDSKSILSQLENLQLPSDVLLVTIDVAALYLNIPHREGIEATLRHLYQNNSDNQEVPFPPNVTRQVLTFILDYNFFLFGDRVYKQIQGTAMGTKMAPHYATLFLDTLENEFLSTRSLRPVFWRRYIDDILMFWTYSRIQLEEFVQALNNFHPTIKFTFTVSDREVVFLDFSVF